MPLQLSINGACGRMGLTVGRLALADETFSIANPLEAPGHSNLGQDYGAILGRAPLGVKVTDAIHGSADVLIDFSSPAGVIARAKECRERKLPIVIGTTGLEKKDRATLEEISKDIPVLLASNMSLGMNVLFQLTEDLATKLGPAFDIEIVETHHHNKKDAPSGSALTLAQAAARGRKADPAKAIIYGREGMVGKRPQGEIAVHALRGGDIVGEHVVSFISEGESVELIHRARSRDIFARGALHASTRIGAKPPGLYELKDLL